MAIEDAYALAYREAVRGLEQQLAALTELRGRASLVLAAAAISLSVLGREGSDAAPVLSWLVILCFALFSLCVLAVVWPHGDGMLSADPQAMLAAHLACGEPDAAVLSSDLIAHIARHQRGNARRLARTSRAFRSAACLLAIQLLLTLIATTATL